MRSYTTQFISDGGSLDELVKKAEGAVENIVEDEACNYLVLNGPEGSHETALSSNHRCEDQAGAARHSAALGNLPEKLDGWIPPGSRAALDYCDEPLFGRRSCSTERSLPL
jgi:hypothetical protein